MPLDRDGHRRLVTRYAGDDRGSRHALRIELAYPTVRELVGGSRRLPFEFTADLIGGCGGAALSCDDRKETRGEEVAVGVVERHGRKLKSQNSNPKSQNPNPNRHVESWDLIMGVWNLGFGIWDLGFS